MEQSVDTVTIFENRFVTMVSTAFLAVEYEQIDVVPQRLAVLAEAMCHVALHN